MNPRPRSATDGGTALAAVAAPAVTAGERFARALAAKDSGALCALLADPVDFQALTPGRHWQAGTGRPGDEITELCSVTPGRVLDREHVAYRVRVRRAGRDYLVEQQAYYRAEGPRITWMRVLCSGYQPLPE